LIQRHLKNSETNPVNRLLFRLQLKNTHFGP